MTYLVNNFLEVDDSVNLFANKINANSANFSGNVTASSASANLSIIGSLNVSAENSYQVTNPVMPIIRPKLILDFSKSKTVDPRITFYRNSSATRINSQGLIELVTKNQPRIDFDTNTNSCKGLLIEEQRTNLLTYTENFGNSYWVSGPPTKSIILPNFTTSPDGSITASKFVAANAGSSTQHAINVTPPLNVSANSYYTFSVFIKAAEYANVSLTISNASYANAVSGNFYLNSNTSSITYAGSGNSGTIFMQPYNNGWYRCSIAGIIDNSSTTLETTIYASNSNVGTNPCVGDNASGIYIWGAQLEQSKTPSSYIPSTQSFTSRSSVGSYLGTNSYIQYVGNNVPRYDGCPTNKTLPYKLLLENASQNLFYYYIINPSWVNNPGPNDVLYSYNSTTAPDGSANATLVIPSSNTGNHLTYNTFAGANSTTYTFSCFVKSGGYYFVNVQLNNYGFGYVTSGVSVNLVNGTVYGTIGNVQNYSLVSYPNGWYRVSVTATSASNTGPSYVAAVAVSPNTAIAYNTFAGNGTSGVYVWGAQVEQGNSASSLIPSYGSPLTRAADVYSSAQTTRVPEDVFLVGSEFNNNFNPNQGTIHIKNSFNYTNTSALYPSVLYADDGTVNNCFGIFSSITTGGSLIAESYSSGTKIVNMIFSANNIANFVYDNIITYGPNYYSSIGNGVGSYGLQINYNNIIPPTNRIVLGALRGGGGNYINGYIQKFAYYPKQLSNTEILSLSTLT